VNIVIGRNFIRDRIKIRIETNLAAVAIIFIFLDKKIMGKLEQSGKEKLGS